MDELHICRICLNAAVRGYKLEEHNIRSYYEYITKQKLSLEDVIPQWVCYECAIMLHKFHKFKEKCLRGLDMLKQIVLREKISYESVAIVNRYSENLISSVGIARECKRVQTVIVKHIYIMKKAESQTGLLTNKPLKNKEANENNNKICNGVKANTNFDIINTTIGIRNTNNDIRNTYNDTSNNDFLDSMSSNKRTYNEGIIKHENINEVYVVEPSINHIKSEMNDSNEINDHISKEVNTNDRNTNHNIEKPISDSEDINYDSDINFIITDDVLTSDEESLYAIKKKSGKVKHKTVTDNTQKEPKGKKKKKEKNKEVILKNTQPLKHVLNPQFWKKINLSEEDAIREFKQREFSNYYLKAKFKCQDCYKGFSKKEMLERHLKQRHDESCGDVVCRFCHMRFRLKHHLVKHIKEHLIIYNCLICKLQCTRLCNAITHQERHTGIKKSCRYCGKEFSHLSTYYTHVRMSHRSAHVCVACGASFVSELGLLQHTKLKHFDNLKQLEEEIRKRREASTKTEATSIELPTAVHSTVESPSLAASDAEEIYCAKCDIKFMSRRAYNLHFFKSDNHDDGDAFAVFHKTRTNHGSRPKIPTTCEHCDKDFPSRQAYKKHHQAEHSHIPLYIPDERDICEICGASVQASSIQYHMKSHTGEREFSCPAPDCGLRFTLKANMQRHYNVKHLGIVYPKYKRKNPGRRKKKPEDIISNDFSPLVRTRSGYFL